MTCSCSEVQVGGRPTGSYNWNPHCPEHGVGTEWWTSPEQVRRRRDEGARLAGLNMLARQRRREGVDIPGGVLSGFVRTDHELCGMGTYWYLCGAGSTYMLGDVY